MSEQHSLKYKRIMLKLSGEALSGSVGTGIDPFVLDSMAQQIAELVEMGVEVGVVIGGGNLFRGKELSKAGLGRVTGDHMGMLATVMNALAMRDALERIDLPARIMSSIAMTGVVDSYHRRKAIAHLKMKHVVLFAAGTGNPFFTTDSAASLRGIEIDADVVLKATKVDGVYTDDPVKNPKAEKLDFLTYSDVLSRDIEVMDHTAICLCRDHKMPLKVFDMGRKNALIDIVQGKHIGSHVGDTNHA